MNQPSARTSTRRAPDADEQGAGGELGGAAAEDVVDVDARVGDVAGDGELRVGAHGRLSAVGAQAAAEERGGDDVCASSALRGFAGDVDLDGVADGAHADAHALRRHAA